MTKGKGAVLNKVGHLHIAYKRVVVESILMVRVQIISINEVIKKYKKFEYCYNIKKDV